MENIKIISYKKAILAIAVAIFLLTSGITVIANNKTTIQQENRENGTSFSQTFKTPSENVEPTRSKDLVRTLEKETVLDNELSDEEASDIFDGDLPIQKPNTAPVVEPRPMDVSQDPKVGGPHIIYVDDDFVDDPFNHVWDTIQEGINDADNGDIVRVYDGIYAENIVVDKTIDLIGNGTSTIIDGGNITYIDAVLVTVDGVTIDNFAIQNAGDDGIELDSQNNVVSNCEFFDSAVGLFVYYASDNTVENCVFHDNIYGLYFYESTYGSVQDCDAYNNEGVGIYMEDADHSTVSSCTAEFCEYGIRIESADYVSMHNCSSSGNEFGTFLYSSEDCLLRDNQQFDNTYEFGIYGDYFGDIDTSNTVNDKPIYHVVNQNDLVFDDSMDIGYLCLVGCNNITMRNLNLAGNMYGLTLEEGTTNCWITQCEISDQYHSGIWIDSSTDHHIDNCTIHDILSYAGIYLGEENILVEDCEVYNYGHFGIYSTDPYDDVTNCLVHDGEMGIRVSDKDIKVSDCQVWNNRDSGIFCYSRSGIVLKDNTIWNSTENFGILPSSVSYLLGMDIDTSNLVNGKPIYFLKNQADMVLDETMNIGWIALVSCTNVTVKNLHFLGFYDGMLLANSNCHIINCSVTGCHYGFLVYDCDNELTFENCEGFGNFIATQFQKSEGNTILGYHAHDNDFGLWIHSSCANNYLRNCNLHDNTYNFAVRGSDAADFRHDIDTSNLCDGKPIYYVMDQTGLTFDDSMSIGFLGLISCDHIAVHNLQMTNNDYGILFVDTTDSEILNCDCDVNYISGLQLAYGSSNNLIQDCVADGGGGNYGLSFYYESDGNTIENCVFHDCSLGIRAYKDDTNHVINNCTFYNNGEGIYLYNGAEYNTITNCLSYDSEFGFDLYKSNYNTIADCHSYNNMYGIDLYSSVTYNKVEQCIFENNDLFGIRGYKCDYGTIVGNTVSDGLYGIYLYTSSDNNEIYHNNIINNWYQAYDECSNTWDNGYLSGGNYWSDFDEANEGAYDNNNDGIVDSPYFIDGGSNEDFFPFINPDGWMSTPPNIPDKPSGRTWMGFVNRTYVYITTTTDPEGDFVYYMWDWGDGEISNWIGPFASGVYAGATHAWNALGSYDVKVKAKDIYGFESDWSEPITVNINVAAARIDEVHPHP
jgi:parallel beta-helix repeat protein